MLQELTVGFIVYKQNTRLCLLVMFLRANCGILRNLRISRLSWLMVMIWQRLLILGNGWRGIGGARVNKNSAFDDVGQRHWIIVVISRICFRLNSHLNRFISGSTIVFIATPRPAIATKKAVVFSIRALNFEVAGWTELNNFCLSCLNAFLNKMKISINFAIR